MKLYFTLVIALILCTGITQGQTTKTVGGTGANYVSLKLAFDAINAGTIKGAIILQISGNTSETASAVLNASGTGLSSYTSLLIYPTATELSISSKKKPKIVYFNTTNSLVKKYKDIVVSKTGWIKSSGGCLIMLVRDQISERAIVVLNSRNTRTRITDGDLLYGIYNNGKNI